MLHEVACLSLGLVPDPLNQTSGVPIGQVR